MRAERSSKPQELAASAMAGAGFGKEGLCLSLELGTLDESQITNSYSESVLLEVQGVRSMEQKPQKLEGQNCC